MLRNFQNLSDITKRAARHFNFLRVFPVFPGFEDKRLKSLDEISVRQKKLHKKERGTNIIAKNTNWEHLTTNFAWELLIRMNKHVKKYECNHYRIISLWRGRIDSWRTYPVLMSSKSRVSW